MSFKDMAESRIRQRAEAREAADELLTIIVEKINLLAVEQQERVLSMVHTELQALTALSKRRGGEGG